MEKAENLWTAVMGARGDPREVKKKLKELQK